MRIIHGLRLFKLKEVLWVLLVYLSRGYTSRTGSIENIHVSYLATLPSGVNGPAVSAGT